MNQEKVTFTKEELAEHVKVPAVVEQDLKRIISDRLEQCGLYFRVFSRIKTASSMAHKFEQKEYGGEKKLQDLVGVRINLYFDDDVDICRYIMAQTFEVVGWSASERSDEEFKPTKLNGVFRLPEYLKAEISPETWNMCIDDTFEIQIKTMFFEGWHEIEHDMRYKGEELWSHYQGFSRYLNSILATLELCDKSMVTLFEDLGHALYKSGRWSDMIKSHFRLKMGDAALYPEVEELLRRDQEHVDNLAKRIYKTNKKVLIDQLLRRSRRVPINVNTIIALLNDGVFHDSRLTAIFRQRDVYNDGREESVAESRHYELQPLRRHTAFQMCTEVDGSRMKTGTPPEPETVFTVCAEQIYQWIVTKYGALFKDMPVTPSTYHADILAYHVAVNLDRKRCVMNMHVRHMDPDIGGRIWYSEANLEIAGAGTDSEKEADGAGRKVILRVSNGFAQAECGEKQIQDGAGMFFSYPGYYKTIVDMVGIFNGLPCSNRRRIIRREQLPRLERALSRRDRKFPIVVIMSKEDKDEMMDEEWLGQFRVSDFTRTVWRYAHVLTCYEEVGRELLSDLKRQGAQAHEAAPEKQDTEAHEAVPERQDAEAYEAVPERQNAEAQESALKRQESEAQESAPKKQDEMTGRVQLSGQEERQLSALSEILTENGAAVMTETPECGTAVSPVPRLYIFWPDGDIDDFGPEDVQNCSFGRHLEARSDARTYDIVRGGQALYHKVVSDLRDWNVSADMWEGFQLEIMTEIPT